VGEMPKERKKNKIAVAAPACGRHEEALHKDTTGVEALEVFNVCEKIGRRLCGFMIAVGALLSLLSVVSILISIEFTFSNPFFVSVLGFLGAINIFCGLILLAKK